jgi:hypothetical protein
VIHIVVPFATGAVQDTVARAFNNELGAALNASAIVENRAGAGGTVGAAIVARAPADGSTLVLAAASHNIAGFLYNKLSYDPLKDFVGVANVGNAGYVLAVTSGQQGRGDHGRLHQGGQGAIPGKYNYASAGNGSATHLAMASFLAKAGSADDAHPDQVDRRGRQRGARGPRAGRDLVEHRRDRLPGRRAHQAARLHRPGDAAPSCPSCRPWPRAACRAMPSIRGSGLLAPAATPKAEVERHQRRGQQGAGRPGDPGALQAPGRGAAQPESPRSSRSCCARTGMRWGRW